MEVVFQKDKQKKNPLSGKFNNLKEKIKSYKFSHNFYYFLILLLIGFGFYVFMLLDNGLSLAYGGDYMAQYIPMGFHVWDYYHDWIKTGHFTLFDSTLYLGANSIGSNAYYGLFSPFNIIIVLLPRSIVPQSVALCSIIKLACAGLFFNMYMSDVFKTKENISRLCGVAYAFCGWGAFYLWYNNYQDILVFFPLVLWGIDKTIRDQKPWLLAVGTFLLAICNYVLMVSYLVCAFFYAMFRFFQKIKEKTAKDNFIVLGLGVLGFATGLLMAMFIFFPALMATMSSPKLEGTSYGGLLKEYLYSHRHKEFFELLFSWKKAADQHSRVFPNRIYYPILEFFFPATTCRSLPTLELYNWDFDDMAVSLWCYVPFILFLVPALIQSVEEKKWSHLIGFTLLTFSLFTPFMYFLTMGLTNGYARWTLFIVSSLLAYVGCYIDKIPNVAKWHIHIGFAFAIAGIVAAWILTWKIYTPDATKGNEFIHRFVEKGYDFTNLAYTIELIYVTVVYLALFFSYNKKAFRVLISIFVSAEAIAMGNFVTLGHGYDQTYNNGYYQNAQFKKVLDEISKNDPSYYRVYSSLGDAYSVNNGFMNNYNTAAFFHSLYNYEVNDFTLWTGLRNGTSSVSGDYRGKYQDLDNLLGVKYYFISKTKSKYEQIEDLNPGQYVANVPFDFQENTEYEKLNDNFFVYENKLLSEFGYSYKTLYIGNLDSAKQNVRYNVASIENIMILSTYAAVSAEDSAEIVVNYPNLLITDLKPSLNTLRHLEYTTDVDATYYYIGDTAKKIPFEDIPNIPNLFTPVNYSVNEKDENKKAMNYYMFINPMVEGQPLLKADTTLYVRAPFYNSKKYNFYFLDKNNKIFMFDAHDDDTTDNVNYMRAFYIKKDVYSIAVCPKYIESYLYYSTLRLYAEDKADYEARRDALNSDPIENVKYQKDKFTFDTNYEQSRFVVSRVAFDKGWSIKAKNNDTGDSVTIKTYKGNGGFVSFVAPKGHYSYTMTYTTPYLTASYLISALSVTSFFASLAGYHLFVEKKNRYLDKIHRTN